MPALLDTIPAPFMLPLVPVAPLAPLAFVIEDTELFSIAATSGSAPSSAGIGATALLLLSPKAEERARPGPVADTKLPNAFGASVRMASDDSNEKNVEEAGSKFGGDRARGEIELPLRP
jgi:hypothetical protein